MPATDAVRPKPRLTFWEIWNMSFGFLGILVGGASLVVAAVLTLRVEDKDDVAVRA